MLCAKCNGSGFYDHEVGPHVYTKKCNDCNVWHIRNEEKARRESRVTPAEFQKFRIDNYQTDRPETARALDKAKEWIAQHKDAPGEGMIIVGSTGTGKTHLATACLSAVIRQGGRGVFWNVPRLLSAIKATFDDDYSGESEREITTEAEQTPLLILDDFAAGKLTDFSADTLYRVLDYRLRNDLATLTTSNLTPDDLTKLVNSGKLPRLWEPLISRVEGTAQKFRSLITSADFRKPRK